MVQGTPKDFLGWLNLGGTVSDCRVGLGQKTTVFCAVEPQRGPADPTAQTNIQGCLYQSAQNGANPGNEM